MGFLVGKPLLIPPKDRQQEITGKVSVRSYFSMSRPNLRVMLYSHAIIGATECLKVLGVDRSSAGARRSRGGRCSLQEEEIYRVRVIVSYV